MSSFFDALTAGARTAYCIFLNTQIQTGAISNAITGLPPQATLDFLSAISRTVCNRENSNPSLNPGGAFPGGQCFTNYRITVTVRDSINRIIGGTDGQVGSTLTYSTVFFGAISRVEPFPVNGNASAANRWAVRVSSLNDTSGNPLPPNSPPRTASITPQINVVDGTNFALQLVSVLVERIDGLPDNCGNAPPPSPPPPNSNVVNIDINYTNNVGVNLVVPVAFVFNQVAFNANAQITIPFTFSFTPTINFTGQINLGNNRVEFNFNQIINTPNGDIFFPPPPSGNGNGDLTEVTNIVNNINNTINSEVVTTINQVNETVNNINNKVDEIANDLEDNFEDVEDILRCLDGLIRLASCRETLVRRGSIVIGQGTVQLSNTVERLTVIRPQSLLYGLEITLTSSFNQRVYKLEDNSDDMEAAFGNISFEYEDAPNGGYTEAGLRLISRRFTCLRLLNNIIPPSRVRISLKPGVSWRLVDLGIFSERVPLTSCFETP